MKEKTLKKCSTSLFGICSIVTLALQPAIRQVLYIILRLNKKKSVFKKRVYYELKLLE